MNALDDVFLRVHPSVAAIVGKERAVLIERIFADIPELSQGVLSSMRIPKPAGLDYVVPRRERYARILHPETEWESPDEILWNRIPRSAIGNTPSRELIRRHFSRTEPEANVQNGNIDRATSRAIAGAIRTSGAEEAIFVFWSGQNFGIQGMGDLLCRGPIEAASEFFVPSRPGPGPASYASPSLWCAPDLSWCVTTDTDAYCTYVAGPGGLIEAILEEPGLVAVPASYSDRTDDPWAR